MMDAMTLPNVLSLSRGPLAFLFLLESPGWRILAILLAMISDSIDGYLARRGKSASRFGAILDPAMDKFFVLFALAVFFFEGKLALWEGCSMIARDFALCVFGAYLAITKLWGSYEFHSIRWGKISTALQFIVLIGLTLNYTFPWHLYALFILFGLLAFIELYQIKKVQTH